MREKDIDLETLLPLFQVVSIALVLLLFLSIVSLSMFSQIFAVWPLPIEAENLCKITAFFETMQIYAENFNIF